MRKNQFLQRALNHPKGFTLLELIFTVFLLGVISAVALPKFLTISSNSRISSLQGLAGAIKSSIDLQHSIAVINEDNGGLENGYIHDGILFDQGYPVALDFDVPFGNFNSGDGTPEILEALNIDLSDLTFAEIINGRESGQITRELYITSHQIAPISSSAEEILATKCYVSYDSFLEVPLKPIVKVVTAGC